MKRTLYALPLVPLYLACLVVYVGGTLCCWLIDTGKRPFVAYERWYGQRFHPFGWRS